METARTVLPIVAGLGAGPPAPVPSERTPGTSKPPRTQGTRFVVFAGVMALTFRP